MIFATCSRKMGFRAGPQDHTFYACDEHRKQLDDGDVMNFFVLVTEPVKELPADDDETECDFCREG